MDDRADPHSNQDIGEHLSEGGRGLLVQRQQQRHRQLHGFEPAIRQTQHLHAVRQRLIAWLQRHHLLFVIYRV